MLVKDEMARKERAKGGCEKREGRSRGGEWE